MNYPERRELAAKIVRTIVDDITDRKGFRQVYESLGEDIRDEMLATWVEDIQRHLQNLP